MKLKINNFRAAFPVLFTPKAAQGDGKLSRSCALIGDPKDPQIAMIEAALLAVAKEKWGTKGEATLKTLRAADKVALHSGDRKDYEGFARMLYVSASKAESKGRVTVIDRDKSPLTEADGRIYAGCYVNAVITLWAQDNAFGKRINAELCGVQFSRDGDAFGGGSAATVEEDDFDDISEGATADDLV